MTIKEYLSSEKVKFTLSDLAEFIFTEFSSSNVFPEFIEDDITTIVNLVTSQYEILKTDGLTFDKVQRIKNKISLFQIDLGEIELRFSSFKSHMPNDYWDLIFILFKEIRQRLNSLIDWNDKVGKDDIVYERTKYFTLDEIICLISLLKKENLFRPHIKNHEIADAFYKLTGLKMDSLKNSLSEKAFSRISKKPKTKTDLQKKLSSMQNHLL